MRVHELHGRRLGACSQRPLHLPIAKLEGIEQGSIESTLGIVET